MACVEAGPGVWICGVGGWQPATRYVLDLDVTPWWFQGTDALTYRMRYWHRARATVVASCCRRRRWRMYCQIRTDAWRGNVVRCRDGRGCRKHRRRRRRAA